MAFNFSTNKVYSGNFNLNSFPSWIFILIGIAIVGVGFYFVYDGQKTANWPTTEGIVRDVDTNQDYDADGNLETTYEYSLVYSVDGKEYTNSKTSNTYTSEGSTESIVYNPENPSDIRVGAVRGILAWAVVAGGVILGIVAAVMAVKKRRTSAVPPAPAVGATPVQPVQPLQSTPPTQQQPPQPPQVPPTNPPTV